MLLSFKFLIACTVGVELLISEENLLFISIGVVFASLFFRCAERRGINHLSWSSDEIDPLAVISLYFTLHLYFGNVDICILGTLFLFRNNRQGVDVVLIGHIQFCSGCFQKECQLNMQLQKHHNLWFQLVCDMVIVGTVGTRCLERKAVLFAAESRQLDQCLSCQKF